jgi:hypothetical protein
MGSNRVNLRTTGTVGLVLASGTVFTSCGVGTNCASLAQRQRCFAVDGRTTRYTDTPTIERVTLDCCSPDLAPEGTCAGSGEWWGDVLIEGNASRVVTTILVQSPEDWTETHTLQLTDRDPFGHWEIRYADWNIANTNACPSYEDCAVLYQPSVSSLVQCTETLGRVRFVVEIYDGSTTPVDCVTWGSIYPRPPDNCRDAEAEGVL